MVVELAKTLAKLMLRKSRAQGLGRVNHEIKYYKVIGSPNMLFNFLIFVYRVDFKIK